MRPKYLFVCLLITVFFCSAAIAGDRDIASGEPDYMYDLASIEDRVVTLEREVEILKQELQAPASAIAAAPEPEPARSSYSYSLSEIEDAASVEEVIQISSAKTEDLLRQVREQSLKKAQEIVERELDLNVSAAVAKSMSTPVNVIAEPKKAEPAPVQEPEVISTPVRQEVVTTFDPNSPENFASTATEAYQKGFLSYTDATGRQWAWNHAAGVYRSVSPPPSSYNSGYNYTAPVMTTPSYRYECGPSGCRMIRMN